MPKILSWSRLIAVLLTSGCWAACSSTDQARGLRADAGVADARRADANMSASNDSGSTTPRQDGSALPLDSAIARADGAAAAPDASSAALGNQVVYSRVRSDCDASCTITEFELDTLRELHTYTLWTGVSGRHVELHKYFAPDGSLYYSKLVAFDTTATEPVPFDPSEQLPHSALVQVAPPDENGLVSVWHWIPVGGTQITQLQMIGQWRLEIYLDKLSGTPDIVSHFTLN